jgi:hypothetical protein
VRIQKKGWKQDSSKRIFATKKTKGKENRLQKEKEKGNKEILILLKEALAEELDEEEETASRGKKETLESKKKNY